MMKSYVPVAVLREEKSKAFSNKGLIWMLFQEERERCRAVVDVSGKLRSC